MEQQKVKEMKIAHWLRPNLLDEEIFAMFFHGEFEDIVCPFCGVSCKLTDPNKEIIMCPKCNENFFSPLNLI